MRCLFLFLFSFLIPMCYSHAQWTRANGSGFATVFTFAKLGNESFAGSIGFGVFHSTDDGSNWSAINTGLTDSSVTALAISDPDLFAGTFASGVFRSTNKGSNWNPVNTGLTYKRVSSLVVSGVNLIAGTSGGIFRSTNSGTNWIPANIGLSDSIVNGLFVSDSTLFAYTNSGIFHSLNGGATWNVFYPTTWPIRALAVSGNNIFIGGNGGAKFTTDNGVTWTSFAILSASTIVALVSIDSYLFVGMQSEYSLFGAGGVEIYTPNGKGWAQMTIKDQLLNQNVYAIALWDDHLVLGTNAGIYTCALSSLVSAVKTQPENIPTRSLLNQNYPNPFNPTTIISYVLAKSDQVTLKLFDTFGREAATFFSGFQTAGSHSFHFEAGNLSSGVYFYQLKTDTYTQTRTMVLLR